MSRTAMNQRSASKTCGAAAPKQANISANGEGQQNKSQHSPTFCSSSKEIDIVQAENELRKLCFENPGKFMENFDPEKSGRELRKIKRRMCKEKVKKNQMYNDCGLLLETSEDLCDCLEMDCPGCHFPCPKCSSAKCGQTCRNNRCWYYETVEIEGTDTVYCWPHQPSPIT